MTTPDDYLGPRMSGELTLANGQVVELTARPHKERGFTDRTLVGIRPIPHRFGTHVSAYLLKDFVDRAEPETQGPHVDSTIGLGEVSLTLDDTKAVLDWLFGQNGESAP